MTCKHLHLEIIDSSPEIGDEHVNPSERVSFHDCDLGRLRFPRKAERCKDVPLNGPCWWWQENHPDEPDTKFDTSQ